jgi:hypothetical protein
MLKTNPNNLPSALSYALIQDYDINILEINKYFIRFESIDKLKNNFTISVFLFDYNKYSFNKYSLNEYKIREFKEKKFCFEYVIEFLLNDCSFHRNLDTLNQIIYKAKLPKSTIDDTNKMIISQPFYPIKKDKIFYTTYQEQENNFYNFDLEKLSTESFTRLMQKLELSYSLNSYLLYDQYLNQESKKFLTGKLSQKKLIKHPIFNKMFSRFYIGNEFCSNLFPPKQLLLDIIHKLEKEKIAWTIVFPFIREDNLDFFCSILETLHKVKTQNKHELVINDFGILAYINNKYSSFKLVLGRLLNKRNKDPKYPWKWKNISNGRPFQENNLSCPHYKDFLSNECLISRVEYDSTNNLFAPSSFKSSLHFPYYQTNTSQYCPLHSECTKFDRTDQGIISSCPHFCDDIFYMFPKHINSIGKGNTIYAFNKEIFEKPSILNTLISNGLDRLVLTTF